MPHTHTHTRTTDENNGYSIYREFKAENKTFKAEVIILTF